MAAQRWELGLLQQGWDIATERYWQYLRQLLGTGHSATELPWAGYVVPMAIATECCFAGEVS